MLFCRCFLCRISLFFVYLYIFCLDSRVGEGFSQRFCQVVDRFFKVALIDKFSSLVRLVFLRIVGDGKSVGVGEGVQRGFWRVTRFQRSFGVLVLGSYSWWFCRVVCVLMVVFCFLEGGKGIFVGLRVDFKYGARDVLRLLGVLYFLFVFRFCCFGFIWLLVFFCFCVFSFLFYGVQLFKVVGW